MFPKGDPLSQFLGFMFPKCKQKGYFLGHQPPRPTCPKGFVVGAKKDPAKEVGLSTFIKKIVIFTAYLGRFYVQLLSLIS
jgi:hypothetical protein